MGKGEFHSNNRHQHKKSHNDKYYASSSSLKKDGNKKDGDDEYDYQGMDHGERHKGSISLELIKESIEYKSRVECNDLKRKYAICFGYAGTNYQGLQINPDCKSIEAELERALFLVGAIHECNFGFMQKLQWSRAARTDRGVHAISQCCAMKLYIPMSARQEFVQKMNSVLPHDIRVHTVTKVTKSFNSKLTCSKRRYQYMLPTYMLMDGSKITASLTDALKTQGVKRDIARVGRYAEPGSSDFLGEEALSQVRKELLVDYRIDNDSIERFRVALNSFVGTRSYHNFTSGKSFGDGSANRYIISFECSVPFTNESNGVEWVLLTVVGQSFLLNQIRKMVGMAAEVARGAATMAQLQDTFTNVMVDVPTAPALGLYLGELYFDIYNERQREEWQKAEAIAMKKKNGYLSKNSRKKLLTAASSNVRAAAKAAVAKALAATVTQSSSAEPLAFELDGIVPALIHEEETCATSLIAATLLTTHGATTITAEPGQALANEEESDAVTTGEPIEWFSDAVTMQKMNDFRDRVVHQHIFQEEVINLHFLYYLDFLRVRRFQYEKR